jgi:hypothetical protein
MKINLQIKYICLSLHRLNKLDVTKAHHFWEVYSNLHIFFLYINFLPYYIIMYIN